MNDLYGLLSHGVPTPEYRLSGLSDAWGIDLWIKRDDLLPEFLGGNKVRKNARLIAGLNLGNSSRVALITNGGAQSNHARVVALIGAKLGWKVHLVLHGENLGTTTLQGNQYFMRAAGAELTFVSVGELPRALEEAQSRERAMGHDVVMIPGGAHSQEGALSYASAIGELTQDYSHIVHASGTGGTQSGLMIGVAQQGLSAEVIGISVARSASQGKESVRSLLVDGLRHAPIHFRDEYRFGGYERYSPELLSFLRSVVRLEGLPLDPTYTGKAM